MALGRIVYNALFKRSSTFFVTIVVGAVLFERLFDASTDALWDRMNKGVSFELNAHMYQVLLYLRHQRAHTQLKSVLVRSVRRKYCLGLLQYDIWCENGE